MFSGLAHVIRACSRASSTENTANFHPQRAVALKFFGLQAPVNGSEAALHNSCEVSSIQFQKRMYILQC